MKCVLHYTETDGCNYFIPSIIVFNCESEEELYLKLLTIHDDIVAEFKYDTNSDNYCRHLVCIHNNLFIELQNISQDMSIQTLDDYASKLECVTLP